LPERFVVLDGLRGIAAICVVIYHFSQHGDAALLPYACFAVDLFFCLSGFVIAKSSLKATAAGMAPVTFVRKRLVRLYPMFAVGIALGVLALSWKAFRGEAVFSSGFLAALIANVVYLPAFGGSQIAVGPVTIRNAAFPFNPPAWTLFYELVINMLFFYLWRSGLTSLRKTGLIVAVIFPVLFLLAFAGRGSDGWSVEVDQMVIGFTRTLGGFAAGVALFLCHRQVALRGGARTWLAPMLAAALVLAFQFGGSQVVVLALMPLTVWIGAKVEVERGVERICRGLGALSYPLYCIHVPIMMILDTAGYHPDRLPVWGPLIATLFLSGLAWAVFVPLDLRLQNWAGRLFAVHARPS
jgi:peptidoglycan/LPS O-acetylase OafA/YrhL